MEAQKYVWEGAIPVQIHLHDSDVTALPPPPPAIILAPRIGYLPLLVPIIKPYFSGALPPGEDTVWFEYKGLPLKWYIPTGVLFDLLCAEPERPWNLTVHFRGYPTNVLVPCEGEDNVKWSFINSLKEAAYIINGNSKNVMNMSQSDQVELWNSVLNGRFCQVIAVTNSYITFVVVSTRDGNISFIPEGEVQFKFFQKNSLELLSHHYVTIIYYELFKLSVRKIPKISMFSRTEYSATHISLLLLVLFFLGILSAHQFMWPMLCYGPRHGIGLWVLYRKMDVRSSGHARFPGASCRVQLLQEEFVNERTPDLG